MAENSLNVESLDAGIPAVKGENKGPGGFGVLGICDSGAGVVGESVTSKGVIGISKSFVGVFGTGEVGLGVAGLSQQNIGVKGESHSKTEAGVLGVNGTGGPGVRGQGTTGRGMEAESDTNYGLRCSSRTFAGLRTSSVESPGIESNSINSHGILSTCNGKGTGVVGLSASGIGVHGKGGQLAGFFEGDVTITGTLTAHNDIVCGHADFAEDFDVAEDTVPGEVMVLTPTGMLAPSTQAYDKKVVGVLSGAGNYKPGIILDKQSNSINRKPVAMMGKVYCKVDADIAPIETGDMLTTSDIPGCAMKAIDPLKSFGAIIGKALAPLSRGKGLIPMLVVLH
ncbi:hypothetical protein ACFFGT_26410 [Mucilaginibacter angelicae]|uniref:Uncharacterized protein n=1 Tax=Mucilaginibacter angelicae TaxID=869718 RepID=A0ABV6LEB4_9SPHI